MEVYYVTRKGTKVSQTEKYAVSTLSTIYKGNIFLQFPYIEYSRF